MTEWESASVMVRHSLGMLVKDQPWTDSHKLEGVPRQNRHLDLVQCAYGAYAVNCKKLKIQVSEHPAWCVDVTQQIDRRPWGPVPRSFNKDSLMYCFAVDRVLTIEDVSGQALIPVPFRE
jgi:hypothetical protein